MDQEKNINNVMGNLIKFPKLGKQFFLVIDRRVGSKNEQ